MCWWRRDDHNISTPVPYWESFKDVMIGETSVLSTRLGIVPVLLFILSKPWVLLEKRQGTDDLADDGAFHGHFVGPEYVGCKEREKSGTLTPGAILWSFLGVAQVVAQGTGAIDNLNWPIGSFVWLAEIYMAGASVG